MNGLQDCMHFSAVIPCAGLSSRMNDFKPLMSFFGKTVIESTIDNFLKAGVQDFVVTLGHNGERLKSFLQSKYLGSALQTASRTNSRINLKFVKNENYSGTDMFTSVQLALRELDDCKAFFILPADMPLVSYKTLIALMDAFSAGVVFPLFQAHRAHPPLVDFKIKDSILNYNGNDGLRGFFRTINAQITELKVGDIGVSVDLDTQEDYKKCINGIKVV